MISRLGVPTDNFGIKVEVCCGVKALMPLALYKCERVILVISKN